jgi:hypothetical protein
MDYFEFYHDQIAMPSHLTSKNINDGDLQGLKR